MDRCLKIPEIIRAVCDELEEGSAYSMALVARRFQDPALDTLWRTLRSLAPIVKCLPGDLWVAHETPIPIDIFAQGPKRIVLRRGIRQADLRRYLDQYAHRVRSIRPDPPTRGVEVVSSEALQALQVATDYKAGVLTPALEHLDYTYLTPEALVPYVGLLAMADISPCLALFMGPNLKSIELPILDKLCSINPTTILRIPKRFPCLKKLYLKLATWEPGFHTLRQFLESSSWGVPRGFKDIFIRRTRGTVLLPTAPTRVSSDRIAAAAQGPAFG